MSIRNSREMKFDNPCNFMKKIYLCVTREGILSFRPFEGRSNNVLKAFILRSRVSFTRDLRDFLPDRMRKNRKVN